MGNITREFKDVITSVLPVAAIVLILYFSLPSIEVSGKMVGIFLIGVLFIILGLSLFLIGSSLSVEPLGQKVGETITKRNSVIFFILVGLMLGLAVTLAEPNLHIMASEYDGTTNGILNKWHIIAIVSVGVSIFLVIGIARIFYNIKIKWVYLGGYALVFLTLIFVTDEFRAVAFDGSASSTGSIITPFILSISYGLASMKKESSEEDSFGLLGIIAIGSIFSVLILGAIKGKVNFKDSASLQMVSEYKNLSQPFGDIAKETIRDTIVSVVPTVIIYLIFNFTIFKMSKKQVRTTLLGFLFTVLGLFLFMLGVNGGFLNMGKIVGKAVGLQQEYVVILVGTILGLVVVFAEPSVHILTKQIEEVTAGYINRKIVLIALCIGAAISILLSMLKIIIKPLKLWHILVPGYFLAVILSFFAPDLFIGIAFDAGGVASGPMAGTFIIAFAQGVASSTEGANILLDGFGVLALVALSPLIILQLVGIAYKRKTKKMGVENASEQ